MNSHRLKRVAREFVFWAALACVIYAAAFVPRARAEEPAPDAASAKVAFYARGVVSFGGYHLDLGLDSVGRPVRFSVCSEG